MATGQPPRIKVVLVECGAGAWLLWVQHSKRGQLGHDVGAWLCWCVHEEDEMGPLQAACACLVAAWELHQGTQACCGGCPTSWVCPTWC